MVVEFSQEEIENAQKSRQRFAAPRGRCEQDRLPIENRGHAEQLRLREISKGTVEPLREPRMQARRKFRGGRDDLLFHGTI